MPRMNATSKPLMLYIGMLGSEVETILSVSLSIIVFEAKLSNRIFICRRLDAGALPTLLLQVDASRIHGNPQHFAAPPQHSKGKVSGGRKGDIPIHTEQCVLEAISTPAFGSPTGMLDQADHEAA